MKNKVLIITQLQHVVAAAWSCTAIENWQAERESDFSLFFSQLVCRESQQQQQKEKKKELASWALFFVSVDAAKLGVSQDCRV